MGLFTSRRAHLRAVDLEQIPETGPPAVHRSIGEVIGAKADAIVRARNRIVDLEGELGRARATEREAWGDFLAECKSLGLPPAHVDALRTGE